MKSIYKKIVKLSVRQKFKLKRQAILVCAGVCTVLFVLILSGRYASILNHKENLHPQSRQQEQNTLKEHPVIASAKKLVSSPLARQNLKIPILMFHHIRDPKPINDKIQKNLSVSPIKFKIDLEWLRDHGYQTYSIDDLEGILSGQMKVSKKPVILTFDDGYEDNYQIAFQDLKSMGMVGNFYIITGAVGKPNYMTDAELQEMSRGKMTLGSHTVSHPDLAKASLARQIKELTDSRDFLDNLLQKNITSLCYPSGKYTPLTLMVAKGLGYKTGTTTKSGFTSASSDPLQLPRLRMTELTDLAHLLP